MEYFLTLKYYGGCKPKTTEFLFIKFASKKLERKFLLSYIAYILSKIPKVVIIGELLLASIALFSMKFANIPQVCLRRAKFRFLLCWLFAWRDK